LPFVTRRLLAAINLVGMGILLNVVAATAVDERGMSITVRRTVRVTAVRRS